MRQWIHPDNEIAKDLFEIASYANNDNLFRTAAQLIEYDAVTRICANNPFYPFPKPEEVYGQLRLGLTIPDGYPFGLIPLSLTRNVLILGNVGTGKTTTIFKIIKELYDLGYPVLVISVSKKDMRNIIRICPDFQVIRAFDFRMNLLENEEWSNTLKIVSDFADIYCFQSELMQRSKSYILNEVSSLYDDFGKDAKTIGPNLEDILDMFIERSFAPGYKRDDFVLRNIQRLKMFLYLSQEIFRCSRGFSIEKMLEYPVVLELDDLNPLIMNMILLAVFTKILSYRVEKGIKGKLLHCVVIDECQRVFYEPHRRNNDISMTPLDQLIKDSRELGEGIIAADQQITRISETFKSCSNTKIAFNVSGENIEDIRKLFGLDKDQTQVLRELPIGTAIVKMGERYLRPFLVQMDYTDVKKDVCDQEVEEHSRDFVRWLAKDVCPRSKVMVERVKKEAKKRVLSREEESFLIHVAKFPFQSIVKRFDTLGLNKTTGTKIVKTICDIKGFVEKIKVYTGKRGNQPVLLELTEKGKEYLTGINVKSNAKGKGGLLHQFFQKKVAIFFNKKGYKTIIEPNIRGANTDVLLIGKAGLRIAVEVALSEHGQLKNIQRDLKDFDRVIMAVERQTILEKIEKEAKKNLSPDFLKRVTFRLLKDFLEKDDG
jgi:hypothetical protein